MKDEIYGYMEDDIMDVLTNADPYNRSNDVREAAEK